MSKKIIRKISPMAQQAVEHYIEQSVLLNKAFPNEALVAARQRAQTLFAERAFPTQRDEDWQYTRLTNFVQNRFQSLGKSALKREDLSGFMPSYPVTKIVFVDGWFSEELSDDLSILPKGVSFESTRGLFEVPGASDALFVNEETINNSPFGLLNSLLMTDGFYLQISARTVLETPVFVLYVQSQENQMTTVRNHVVLEENAEMTLVEQFVTLTTDDSFKGGANVVTEMSIASSARMKQVLVQQQNHASYYFNNQFVFQAGKSSFNTFYAGLGARLSRHENHLFMNGEHIENRQNSACLGRGEQVMDSRTNTQHNQVWGQSQQLHKYVLDGAAVGVFNGMIRVDQLAQKTDGQMDNKNLLLSTQAKMNCKPQLEIYADDVKCSHGSATGQIDEEQIFYLQARGIPRQQAVEMITQAFLIEPTEDISNPAIRQWVATALMQQLNAKDAL